MLTKVEISNYRGFESYRMEGLKQVNLLVGKNNSGKTALLEGIHFLTSGGDISVLAEVAQRRGETINSKSSSKPQYEIAHFFHGHVLSLDLQIELKGDNGFNPLKTHIVQSKIKSPEGQTLGSLLRPFTLRIEGATAIGHDPAGYRLTREGGFTLDENTVIVQRDQSGVRRINLFDNARTLARFICTESLDISTIAYMRDLLVVEGKEKEVDETLKILDENVESVQMLTGMLPNARYGTRAGAVVGLRGHKGRVPLGSMGDGMRRLLALATSLVGTKSGSIFVDEIDTGLHYSVMADMWKLVVAKAIASDIQVFATTHSWDCIEGLSELCQREPQFMDKVAVHKIDRAIPHSIPFDGKALVGMVRSDIDPR